MSKTESLFENGMFNDMLNSDHTEFQMTCDKYRERNYPGPWKQDCSTEKTKL